MSLTYGKDIIVQTTRSADGTAIAYQHLGDGPTLILISPALHDHRVSSPLAEALATQFTVICYDRRGRGDSEDTPPYEVSREVEDLAALITAAGRQTAAVYGHSSGAALALHAAAQGLPISKLVVHEPPYGPDTKEHRQGAREIAENLTALLAEGRYRDAVRLFLTAAGMPPEVADQMSQDPATEAMAPTLAYDMAVTGNVSRGGTVPNDLLPAVRTPTLVLNGGKSPGFMLDTGSQIADAIPDTQHRVLDGQEHFIPPEVLTPVLTDFLTD